jgi:hypothetical protein
MGSIIAGLIVLFFSYPVRFSLPIIALLLTVVILNQQLYVFCAHSHGYSNAIHLNFILPVQRSDIWVRKCGVLLGPASKAAVG